MNDFSWQKLGRHGDLESRMVLPREIGLSSRYASPYECHFVFLVMLLIAYCIVHNSKQCLVVLETNLYEFGSVIVQLNSKIHHDSHGSTSIFTQIQLLVMNWHFHFWLCKVILLS